MDRRRQARGSDEESNYKESDIDRQRKVLPVARALGRRRSWFHCACRVRLSYLRPSPFLLAISSTGDALCLRRGRRSRRMMRTLGNMEVFTQLTNELSSDTHGEERRTRGVALLDEGLARDHTRCCTRVQCHGRGRGMEKSNINCEEHQYLHYQMA